VGVLRIIAISANAFSYSRMAKAFMTNPTQPLIEKVLQAALDHGKEEGSEVEAGDLQEMLRATWSLLTVEQHSSSGRRPRRGRKYLNLSIFDKIVAGGPQ
jgi:hypothetical protein